MSDFYDSINQSYTPKRRVYYAHCIALYGTAQERRDLVLLDLLGFIVDNPNNQVDDAKAKELGIAWFRTRVQQNELLIFRALPDGAVPAGVLAEIEWALEANMPVLELPSGIERRGLSVTATRAYLCEVGVR